VEIARRRRAIRRSGMGMVRAPECGRTILAALTQTL
jgi:hypothetical protein